jgi:nicotinate-nucleotide adenylyltransferase
MIGIYGGTFDPVHIGHLRTALEVSENLGLDELRFIPCQVPPHRPQPAATPTQRRAMLELTLADGPPGFRVDPRELNRPGPSYMVDTLVSLREEVGHRPLILILGLDAFLGLPAWHRWRDIPKLAHLGVMRRPGQEPRWPAELEQEIHGRVTEELADLESTAAGRAFWLNVTQLDISASHLRRLISAGKSPCYLTPEAVVRYITQHGLYRE